MKAFSVTDPVRRCSVSFRSRTPDGAWILTDHATLALTDDDLRTIRDAITEHLGDARTGVVIDPEDRDEVERLAAAAYPWYANSSRALDIRTLQFQEALREFAHPKPPPVAEPTGLGAVVVDDTGVRWTRADASDDEALPWYSAERGWSSWFTVSTAGQIVSPGVES